LLVLLVSKLTRAVLQELFSLQSGSFSAAIGGMPSLVAANFPSATLIFLAGSEITLLPLMLATAIGLLAYDRD
jgi:hypothetical protein